MEDESGSNPNRARVQPSTSRCPVESRTAQILFAEDNPGDVLLVEDALAMHGVKAELHVVTNGEAAMDWISRVEADPSVAAPDLVLLDLNLPRRRGTEVLAHIRRGRRLAAVPVLIVTSSDARSDRDEARELGANGFFNKPSAYDAYVQIGKVVKDLLTPPEPEKLPN
jgi:CheY-like chemotaxis protein